VDVLINYKYFVTYNGQIIAFTNNREKWLVYVEQQMAGCMIQTTKGSAAVRKTRTWKSLKQIVAAERSLQWTADTALCEWAPQFSYCLQ